MRTLFLQLSTLKIALAIIAYDCGHEKLNQTRISLLTVEQCNVQVGNISKEKEDIQLLQLTDIAQTHVYQCKINILQSIYYCGMFSHLSLVPGGLSTFIAEVSKEECMQIHKVGTYKLQNNQIITGIKTNSSSRYSEVVAGSLDSTGYCKGASFGYGSNFWKDVIVMQAIEITITDYHSSVHLGENQVVLRNQVLCDYTKGKCLDPEHGMSFWDMVPDTSCEALNYDVVYEGNATKLQDFDINSNTTRIIYSVSTGDIVFALQVTKPVIICQQNGLQTEHPRLVIVKRIGENYWFKGRETGNNDLDLFVYFNSKFVYVERHIKTQIEALYTNLLNKKCELEREVLRTQLAVAHYHPPEFAFMRFQEPGYTAISRGEVIYLIKCQAVEVILRKTERCFNELPVYYKNSSYFMAPTTHLLQKYGTEIPCSSTLIPGYFLHGSWFGFNPQSHRLDTPQNLKPSKEVPWKYEDPHDLIKSGIYSFEATEDIRKQIMYPSEKRAIENVLTHAVMGSNIDQQDLNVKHFELDLKYFTTFLQGTWSVLIQFGNASAGALAVWMILRMLKYLLTILINAHLLKRLYGWNWKILAAVWPTLANYILHQRHQTNSDHLAEVITSSGDNMKTRQNEVGPGKDLGNKPEPEQLEEDAIQDITTQSSLFPPEAVTLKSMKRHAALYPNLRVTELM